MARTALTFEQRVRNRMNAEDREMKLWLYDNKVGLKDIAEKMNVTPRAMQLQFQKYDKRDGNLSRWVKTAIDILMEDKAK